MVEVQWTINHWLMMIFVRVVKKRLWDWIRLFIPPGWSQLWLSTPEHEARVLSPSVLHDKLIMYLPCLCHNQHTHSANTFSSINLNTRNQLISSTLIREPSVFIATSCRARNQSWERNKKLTFIWNKTSFWSFISVLAYEGDKIMDKLHQTLIASSTLSIFFRIVDPRLFAGKWWSHLFVLDVCWEKWHFSNSFMLSQLMDY